MKDFCQNDSVRNTATLDQRKPKVLFVGAFPPAGIKIFGGNVTACRILMQSSFPNRIDLDLLDSTQISNPPPGFWVRLKLAIKRLLLYNKMFQRKKPDCLLLFCSAGMSFFEKSLMAWCAKIRSVHTLIFPRGGALMDYCKNSRFNTVLVKLALGGSKKFLCQGPRWQDFATKTCGFNKKDAPVIPNWTASQEFLKLGRERRHYTHASPLRVLYVGSVERRKGVFDLIEMARLLVSNGNKKIRVSIAGDGHAMTHLKELIESNHLKQYFYFHGWADSLKLLKLYSSNDVFILPSYTEGLPNAMIEAMASGLAVVVTPVGTIPDVISNNINGLIIPPKAPDAMADAISRLMKKPELLERLARAGYSTANERFAVEPAVEKLLLAINSVVKEK
jgi:glycosyltransferase involved in cell wall biosynthesis